MKNLPVIFIALFAVAISSCSMARLDKYPGVKQDSIPTEFRGDYYLKLKQTSTDPNDSIWIGISAHKWVYKEGKKSVTYKLSADHVLSKVGKYYVMSVHDEAVKKYWNSWVVIPKRKDLELYPIVTIRHPNSDKLSNFLTNKYGGMSGPDSVFYYEMVDDAFVKYFEKEIKGSKTFEVIRIKDKK